MNEKVNFCSQCGAKISSGVKFCSSCGNNLTNSSTKTTSTTSDKTIKVEVTNVTVEKGFKAIEKVVKAPGATLKKGVKATGKVVTETIKTLEYDFWIPVALLIGVVVFFVVFSGDINR